MNSLQAWLIFGIPGLAVVVGMFAGRSVVRSAIGYLALALTFVLFLLVANDPASAAVIGAIGFLLVAIGRGSTAEEESHDDHPEAGSDSAPAQAV